VSDAPKPGLRLAAWLVAAGLAAGAHAALGLALGPLAPPPIPEADVAGALAVEIALLPAAPEPPAPPDDAPAPEAMAGDGAPAVEPAPEPAPIPEPAPEPAPIPEPETRPPLVADAAPPDVAPPVVLPPSRPGDLPRPRRERAAQAPATVGSPGRDAFDSAAAAARPTPQRRERAAAPETARPAVPSPAAEARWQAQLLARLERHKRYPASARARRIEGVVQLAFGLDASGGVTTVRVARSSGSPDLDEAALAMVRRASPLPAPPAGPTTVTVPVRFDLR